MKDTIIHKFNNYMNTIYTAYSIKNILIAISGGTDSICLIKLINSYKHVKKLNIHCIYIDHQWTKNSKIHVKHLINHMQYYGFNIIIYQINSITYSEMHARKIRYKIILNHAIRNKYQAIITGHNNTDKIETFIQLVIRGTSINGATSLTFVNKINKFFFRPLIDLTKSELIYLCRYLSLPIWSDTTNYNYSIQRNRIRYELLPYLKNYFSSSIEKQITSFLKLTNIDNEYLKQNTLKIYLISHHENYIALNHLFIREQHRSLQARIIQLFFYHNFYIVLKPKVIKQIINIIKNKFKHTQIIKCSKITISITKYWIYII